jgi:hypothetical protein
MYVIPEISKEEAENILSQKRTFLPIRFRKKTVPLKRVELIHLPFYLFDVMVVGQTEIEKQKEKVTISLDGLVGDNLFFVGGNIKYRENVDNPVCPFVLSQSEAQQAAMDKYKWQRLEQGLRMKQKYIPGEIIEVRKIFYPFWVGYFQRGKGYDFKLMDGVSGEVQGIRMRKVFLKALRYMD